MQFGILDLFDRVTVMEDFARALEKTTIEDCRVFIDENRLEIRLLSPVLLDRVELLQYRDAIRGIYHIKTVDLTLKYTGITADLSYFEGLLAAFLYQNVVCRSCLSAAQLQLDGDILTVSNIRGGKELLRNRKFLEYLQDTAQREFGTSINPVQPQPCLRSE